MVGWSRRNRENADHYRRAAILKNSIEPDSVISPLDVEDDDDDMQLVMHPVIGFVPVQRSFSYRIRKFLSRFLSRCRWLLWAKRKHLKLVQKQVERMKMLALGCDYYSEFETPRKVGVLLRSDPTLDRPFQSPNVAAALHADIIKRTVIGTVTPMSKEELPKPDFDDSGID